jgi:hypothetical protein
MTKSDIKCTVALDAHTPDYLACIRPRRIDPRKVACVIQVREACGAGMHMVNGVCRTTVLRRQTRRCLLSAQEAFAGGGVDTPQARQRLTIDVCRCHHGRFCSSLCCSDLSNSPAVRLPVQPIHQRRTRAAPTGSKISNTQNSISPMKPDIHSLLADNSAYRPHVGR